MSKQLPTTLSNEGLDSIQSEFIHAIYESDANKLDNEEPSFVKSGALSAAEQIAVYRGSIVGGLVQALGDIYPAIKMSVGERFFDAMATKYVSNHPSQSSSLDNYGTEFPGFIANFKPLQDYPYLADLARLEWLWHLSFHAADPEPMDFAALSQVPPESQNNLIFELQKSAKVLISDYPLLQLWQVNQPETRVAESHDAAPEIDWNQSDTILVWRDGLDTRLSQLNDVELALFTELSERKNLGTILGLLGSKFAPEHINQALAEFVQRHWITGFSLDSAP